METKLALKLDKAVIQSTKQYAYHDLLYIREPFYAFAAEVFTLGDERKLRLSTTSLVYANVFYILRKLLGIEKAKELLYKLRLIVHVTPSDERMVDLALNS